MRTTSNTEKWSGYIPTCVCVSSVAETDYNSMPDGIFFFCFQGSLLFIITILSPHSPIRKSETGELIDITRWRIVAEELWIPLVTSRLLAEAVVIERSLLFFRSSPSTFPVL